MGDTFVAHTLPTEDPVPAWQFFHNIPPPTVSRRETKTILKIGSGVNGHVDICQRGIVSLLLDKVIETAADHVSPPDKSTMTAYLKVDYKRPVPTLGVVLRRAWIERTEGRKLFGIGTVEDGRGTEMTIGEALFLTVAKVAAEVKSFF
jgi:hypothetical protein